MSAQRTGLGPKGALVAQEDGTALDTWPTPGGGTGHRAGADCGEALRASEQRLRQEFGSAPVGLAVISLADDRPGAYLAVNDAYCQLTGFSREELTGAGFLGDVHPQEQPALETLIGELAAGRTSQLRADTRLVRKDGEIILVRLSGSAVQRPGTQRYLPAYVEDRTAAEAAQAEIQRLEHELLHAHRLDSLGQLVGGITHDFNNLLAVISNYATVVREEISAAEAAESATRWEPVRRDVEQIEAAADRATRLIKRLLAFARRHAARPALVNVDQLVGDVIRLLGQVLGEHVGLVYRPAADLWPVQADAGQLEQAIINIVVNARDAMPSGGQVIIHTANLAIPPAAGAGAAGTDAGAAPGFAADQGHPAGLVDLLAGRYVRLSISDTGTGMDAATAERAFEPFFTTKGGDQAAGLGLAVVRKFAARAGGRAWLRSAPGGGTTVTMLLPAAASSDSGTDGAAAEPPAAAAERASTVLVVDDEAAIRDVAHRVLTQAGYSVVTAPSPAEALGLLQNAGMPADLLLTDVVMPGMTGGAFAAAARAARPGLRVLFMSGYEQPVGLPDSSPGSAAQVLDKPFSRAALLAKVSELLTAGPGASPAS